MQVGLKTSKRANHTSANKMLTMKVPNRAVKIRVRNLMKRIQFNLLNLKTSLTTVAMLKAKLLDRTKMRLVLAAQLKSNQSV